MHSLSKLWIWSRKQWHLFLLNLRARWSVDRCQAPIIHILKRIFNNSCFTFTPCVESGLNLCSRMTRWNSTRCDIYRSVRNAIKLTKWQEMLRSQPLWGHFWRILCYEAGHKWTQPTLHCTCCAVSIGRHNCRHYNWLAAASVLGCLQNHKNNTSFSFCSWNQN